MTPAVFVQWGGQAGSGFTPYVDERRPPAAKPFQAVAAELVRVNDGVPQPPGDVPDIAKYPALGLRVVPVAGLGDHWCFSVQVKGGDFGWTGVCQFLFAPVDRTDPALLWEHCVGAVLANNGVLPSSIADDGLPDGRQWRRQRVEPPKEVVAGVLTNLLDGLDHIGFGGSPPEVAATIAAVLRVLPTAEIAGCVWSTYLLVVPTRRQFRHVSGLWPDELRGDETANRVDRWLTSYSTGQDAARDFVDPAIDWLASWALGGEPLEEYRSLPSIRHLVAEVESRKLTFLSVDDIEAALESEDERVLLPENQASLTSWVRADPSGAVEWLRRTPPGLTRPQGVVFHQLVNAHLVAPDTNPLRLPILPEADPVWFRKSVDLVRWCYPNPAEMVRLIREDLAGRGAALRGREAMSESHDWFTAVGLAEDDPALADLFPVSADAVVAAFHEGNVVTSLVDRYFRSFGDVVSALRELVVDLPSLTPWTALALMGRAGGSLELTTVLRLVLEHNEGHPDGFGVRVSDWFLAALAQAEDPAHTEVLVELSRPFVRKREQNPSPHFVITVARAVVELPSEESRARRDCLRDLVVLAHAATVDVESLAARVDSLELAERERISAHADELDQLHKRLGASESARRDLADEVNRLEKLRAKEFRKEKRATRGQVARSDLPKAEPTAEDADPAAGPKRSFFGKKRKEPKRTVETASGEFREPNLLLRDAGVVVVVVGVVGVFVGLILLSLYISGIFH